MVPKPLTSRWLVEQFSEDRYWVWLTPSNTIAAVAGLKVLEAERVHLTRFGIAPVMRGRGLAGKLLADIANTARELGMRQVTLSVYLSNSVARHVYTRAGYKMFEELPGQNDPGGAYVRMRLTL